MTASNPRQTVSSAVTVPVRTLSRPGLLKLVIGCAAMVCTAAAAADDARHSASLHYYGVLGQVTQPGSYSSPDAGLTLEELVTAAGGLTEHSVSLGKAIRLGRSGVELIKLTRPDDKLVPGDVVIFDRVAAADTAAESASPRASIDVAFVGLYPGQPVVVALPRSSTSLQQLLTTLGQSPELIRTLQVVRTSPQAPRPAPGHHPAVLHDGDIVLFRPDALDLDALARAAIFPGAIPVNALLTPVSESETLPLPVVTARQVRTPAAPPVPLGQEPARRLEPLTAAQRSESSPAQDVVTASMIDDQAAPGEPAPLHMNAEASDDLEQPDFAADSFTRLAMASTPMDAAKDRPRSDTETRLAAVPAPFDIGPLESSQGRGARTTALGITVLIIAVICFATSMLWSRIDEIGGLFRTERREVENAPAASGAAAPRRPVDELIDNALPLIEEQASLPERVEYHGPAVGRRRIRIDARHPQAGPHFGRSTNTIGSTQAIAAAATSAGERQIRIDRPGGSADTDSTNANHESNHAERRAASKPTGSTNGGLLERILVAMEREKRR